MKMSLTAGLAFFLSLMMVDVFPVYAAKKDKKEQLSVSDEYIDVGGTSKKSEMSPEEEEELKEYAKTIQKSIQTAEDGTRVSHLAEQAQITGAAESLKSINEVQRVTTLSKSGSIPDVKAVNSIKPVKNSKTYRSPAPNL